MVWLKFVQVLASELIMDPGSCRILGLGCQSEVSTSEGFLHADDIQTCIGNYIVLRSKLHYIGEDINFAEENTSHPALI